MSTGRDLGPSGKPKRHFSPSSRKDAKNAAQEAGKGEPPIHHQAHKPGQQAHFHPADKDGNKVEDGSHYQYGKKAK
ncbi:unnamed protein product [Didymodactylos carnosus]|uniref:Uncharacterized protein n=1 Tax=Didymodactylos carnosus TaxID=1234261 RepID=A0A816DDY7_9BILA|nr:unnamed protein product [Didymodactylos carnosus]CAF1633597.1 unnamed protein product [Didymodactylos carnosus]CAF3860613.1 unnamed protein product [Didymodactylos carnosus]CAF4536110.1 unnamed protein product [Didymodactylos carnosus]